MRRSWQNPSNQLYKLLQGCKEPCGSWVYHALKFLPPELFGEWKDKLAFYSTTGRDACRVSRSISQEREIILLSERIVPSDTGNVWAARYFIFAVLHDIAHAVRNHKPPGEIADNQAQEDEADKIALAWFNEHVQEKGHPDFKKLTMEEVDTARRIKK